MQAKSNRHYIQRLTELRLRVAPCRVHLDKLLLIARRYPGKRFNLTWCESGSDLYFRLSVIVRPRQPEVWELRSGDKLRQMRVMWVKESYQPTEIYDTIFDSFSTHTRLKAIERGRKEYASTVLQGLNTPAESNALPINKSLLQSRPFV